MTDAPKTDHLMGVYNRAPLAFDHGKGARLWSTEGEAYLDCVAGIATDALGHAHPVLVEALKRQGEKLWHVSNIYGIPEQEALAERLTAASFADVVFFTNSGTEAIECALKAARKYHSAKGNPERIDIIGFDGSFHGRTYAAINAAGNPGYVEGFGPRLPGYLQASFGDQESVEALVGPTTAAIIIEPVQGEGGARVGQRGLAARAARAVRPGRLLLIFDEVQCGMGRTGKLFAYEWAGTHARHHGDRQGAGRRLSGRRLPGHRAGGQRHDASARTARPSAATRWPWRSALAAFDESTSPRPWRTCAEVAGYFGQQLQG